MKRRFIKLISLLVIVVMMLGICMPVASAAPMPFVDVRPGMWFYDAINWAYQLNVARGTSPTTFSPNNNITRGEFVTFLYRIEDSPPTVSNFIIFGDVPDPAIFYFFPITWAAENGIVTGTGGGRFEPNRNITREEMAVILFRYAAHKGRNTTAPDSILNIFYDGKNVSGFALEATRWAANTGILRGTNHRLNSKSFATRAEAVAVIQRYVLDQPYTPPPPPPALPRIIEVRTGSRAISTIWSDGTVRAMGNNNHGLVNVGNWANVVQVAVGSGCMAGRRADGSLIAAGNPAHFSNLASLNNPGNIAISAGGYCVVVLRSDGTVRGAGMNQFGQLNVNNWTNIKAIAAGGNHTVGLRTDGRVVAVGRNEFNQIVKANELTGISQIAAGSMHTVALRTNGTVVAVGAGWHPQQLNTSGWTNIVAVDAGTVHTVGLRSDGRVVATGENQHGQLNVGSWTNIVQISAAGHMTAALTADGRVIATGSLTDYGRPNVNIWN